jgi:hypothetical protein
MKENQFFHIVSKVQSYRIELKTLMTNTNRSVVLPHMIWRSRTHWRGSWWYRMMRMIKLPIWFRLKMALFWQQNLIHYSSTNSQGCYFVYNNNRIRNDLEANSSFQLVKNFSLPVTEDSATRVPLLSYNLRNKILYIIMDQVVFIRVDI